MKKYFFALTIMISFNAFAEDCKAQLTQFQYLDRLILDRLNQLHILEARAHSSGNHILANKAGVRKKEILTTLNELADKVCSDL